MTLKFAIYGLCFGWLLMPKWRSRTLKVPVSVLAYSVAVISALLITCYFDYMKQAWVFVIGMAIQLTVFAIAKWLRYFLATAVRKIRR